MKVKELIAILAEQDPERRILTDYYGEHHDPQVVPLMDALIIKGDDEEF